MSTVLPYLLFGILGFAVAEFIAGKEEGEPGKIKSVKIKHKDTVIHIHHWLFCAALALVWHELYASQSMVPYFLAGTAIQGFTYNDFYKVVYKDKKSECSTIEETAI